MILLVDYGDSFILICFILGELGEEAAIAKGVTLLQNGRKATLSFCLPGPAVGKSLPAANSARHLQSVPILGISFGKSRN